MKTRIYPNDNNRSLVELWNIMAVNPTDENTKSMVLILCDRLEAAEKRIADLEVAMKRLERLTGNYTLVKDSSEEWEANALKEYEEQEASNG